ncbi:MAG: branched-chain-amino-acid transaminase [Candidatus Methanomethyliaceae archaeon]|nr:branched-chain-amino-acid transaminase [Candidatus Methanomethyliaceae archaeon]MDW7970871.1 branched-chain-amino-acid transaminase [Nitrososphaerota archaeon]
MEPLVYINGELVPKSEAKISVFDHGFLYGDGVFEGIRAYNGYVFKLYEHLDRLYASAHTIMLTIPMKKEEMAEAVIKTLRANSLRNAYVRLVVTRGEGDLGLDPRKCKKPNIIIIAGELSVLPKEVYERGVRALISWVRRDRIDATSHEVKSLNYLNSILAKLEANNVNFDEAIILSSDGYVCEGTAENIFIVKKGELLTPPTYTGALPGITRQVVMEIATNNGIKVIERLLTVHELFNADEVFFTGTGVEIIPVVEISGRKIGSGKPGEITNIIIEEFRKYVSDPRNGTPIY